jgi:hypothetical protein
MPRPLATHPTSRNATIRHAKQRDSTSTCSPTDDRGADVKLSRDEVPTIDIAVGYSKSNTPPILELFVARFDELVRLNQRH